MVKCSILFSLFYAFVYCDSNIKCEKQENFLVALINL